MYSRFDREFDLDKNGALNLYISTKELEIGNIDKMVDYACEQEETKCHVDFLYSYQKLIEEHITTFRRAIKTAKELSIQLDAYLNDIDAKVLLCGEDTFCLEEKEFVISYYRSTFSFLTNIEYDNHIKMNIQASFNYTYNDKGNRLNKDKKLIRFSTKTINDARNYPTFILKEMDRMDEEISVEGVNVRFKKCEQLLFNSLHIFRRRDLIEYNDLTFNTLFGNPMTFHSRLIQKRINAVIKLQLKEVVDGSVTDSLISLIKTENSLKSHIKSLEEEDDEEFQEMYEKFINDAKSDKKELMKTLEIDQHTLDSYISHISLEID